MISSDDEKKMCITTMCDDNDTLVVTDPAILDEIRAHQLSGSRCSTSRQYAILSIRPALHENREPPRVCSMPYLLIRGVGAIRACVAVCERLHPCIAHSPDTERGNAPRWFFDGDKYTLVPYPDAANIKEDDAKMLPEPTTACVVCLDAAATMILLPCAHVCLCTGCGTPNMISQSNGCPLCRQPVVSARPIF
jgi:hypothetical protein